MYDSTPTGFMCTDVTRYSKSGHSQVFGQFLTGKAYVEADKVKSFDPRRIAGQ